MAEVKSCTMAYALSKGCVTADHEYRINDKDIRIIAVSTPNKEYIIDNDYITPLAAVIAEGKMKLGDTEINDGDVVVAYTEKLPKNGRANALLLLGVKAFLTKGTPTDGPEDITAAAVKIMYEVFHVDTTDVMRSVVKVNRKTEKSCRKYLKHLERDALGNVMIVPKGDVIASLVTL